MADEAQVKILKEEGVAAWNEWRKANPEIRPNLIGANLKGINLSGIDLSAVDLKEADLRGANLSGANLIEADLHFVELRRANLREAYLARANFGHANLTGAKLNGAKLNGAILFSANLSKANLTEADLSASNLNRAKLNGVKLSGATANATTFANVDLSTVTGIETVKHLTPSTIGIDTIYRSGGNIPEVFLRGAGVPEPFIVQMKSLVSAMSPIEFYSCFISYSHENKAFARKLHDSLQARDIRCWLDERQLLPGDDIYHEVDQGIRLWDKMLLCCSQHSLKSWWVDNEIGTAFEKEQQLMKERDAKVQVLVPLNLDGYLFTDKWKSGYQAQIRRRLAADFTESGTDSTKFDTEVERLIRALRADEGAREKPPKGKL